MTVSEIIAEWREDIEQGGDCLIRSSELEALLDSHEAMRVALENFVSYDEGGARVDDITAMHTYAKAIQSAREALSSLTKEEGV